MLLKKSPLAVGKTGGGDVRALLKNKLTQKIYDGILITINKCPNLTDALNAAKDKWSIAWTGGKSRAEIIGAAQAAFKDGWKNEKGKIKWHGCVDDNATNRKNVDILSNNINEFIEGYMNNIMAYTEQKKRGGGRDDGEPPPEVTTRDETSTETYQELAEKVTGKLRTSLDTCTEDLSRCEQEKEKNRKAIEELTANVAALQADLRTQISSAAKGSQDLTAKLGELDSAKSSDAESTKALSDATEQYKALIAESQTKLANTDTQLKETHAKIEGLVAEVEAADKKTQENEALIGELKGVIARLQPQQKGGAVETHPLLALAAAISAAATTLLPN